MNTETVIKRRAGRPALGNVLFARRVSPAKARELEELLRLDGGPRIVAVEKEREEPLGIAIELAGVKKQLEEMTADYVKECEKVEARDLSIRALEMELESSLSLSEDDKVRYWRDRAFRAEAAIKAKGGEFDQGG